jgi:membrane protein implicated in regulation of membrane protease activity
MATLYLLCAAVGGTVLVLQLILTLVGLGGHEGADVQPAFDGHLDANFHGDVQHNDAAPAHDSSWFFSVISFKSIVAALAFFGTAGMAALSTGLGEFLSLAVAIPSALFAMIIVAWLMQALYSLNAQGNVYMENALGEPGTVYLSIPAARGGMGKVTVTVQGRTMQFAAETAGEALPTGTLVSVTNILGNGRVEVMPAAAPASSEEQESRA